MENPSVTLVEERGSHDWTAAEENKKTQWIQTVRNRRRCNPLSDNQSFLAQVLWVEAIYLTYAFSEVSLESFNKEIAQIQFTKPKEKHSCYR